MNAPAQRLHRLSPTNFATRLGLGLLGLGLLGGAPAWAAGAFVSPTGGLFADEAGGIRDLRQVRALIIEDGDAHVMLVQGAAESLSGGMAWLVPLPVAPESPPLQAPTEGLDTLLAATDPLYPSLSSCGGCTDCDGLQSANAQDSGELVDVRTFGDVVAAGNRAWFGPESAEAMLAELDYNGLQIDAGVEAAILAYAAQGWGTLVVQLSEDADEGANSTPVVALRVPAGAPTLPMLLSARSVSDELEAVVLTVGLGPFGPTEVPQTQPLLGKPLYAVSYTPTFYEARLRVAVQEAGGGAWALEYSGAGPSLLERYSSIDAASGGGGGVAGLNLASDTAEAPTAEEELFGLFDELVEAGLLTEGFTAKGAHFTRWRTFLKPEDLRDQAFAPDPAVPTFEVTLSSSSYDARLELLLWPALLGVGALRRRRVR